MKHKRFADVSIKGNGAFSEVFVEGVKINGVRDFKIKHRTGGTMLATITLNVMNLTIDGKMAFASKDYPNEEMIFIPRSEYLRLCKGKEASIQTPQEA